MSDHHSPLRRGRRRCRAWRMVLASARWVPQGMSIPVLRLADRHGRRVGWRMLEVELRALPPLCVLGEDGKQGLSNTWRMRKVTVVQRPILVRCEPRFEDLETLANQELPMLQSKPSNRKSATADTCPVPSSMHVAVSLSRYQIARVKDSHLLRHQPPNPSAQPSTPTKQPRPMQLFRLKYKWREPFFAIVQSETFND